MNDEEDNGHYVAYVPRDFRADALLRIETANKIIVEYERKGMPLTLRQLYYQHVARGLLPNHPREYAKLGDLINDGRLAGLISWTAIEDRGRNLKGLATQISPVQAVKNILPSYRIDKWHNQEWRPEVWVEKTALEGVVGSICNTLQVDFFACHGYNSQSEQWRAGRRFAGYLAKGQRPIVFHLGDHDPSGIDMTRDNRDRLTMFCGHPVLVVRIALNMDQVERYKLPPNPAKLTDTRATGYIAKYGDESWELDALDPEVIRDLIKENLLRIRNEDKWNEALTEEAHDKLDLESMIETIGEDK